ncbi:MAG: FadR/GntR family transcriptional regulator [Niabella sp.]
MEPIQRKSLAQEVADLVKQQIQSGVFPVGTKLPTEPELMKSFSVGRSTIREAGKYLAQSGFVHVKQGLGTFVISQSGNYALDDKIGNAGFAEVFEVRQLLELQIIEKSVRNRTQAHLAAMQDHLQTRKRFAQEGNLESCIKSDIDFHTVIAESCGNFILSELYKTLSLHVSKFFSEVYQDTTPFTISQQDHEKLLQYIKRGNKAKALETAKKIIGNL